MSSTSTRIFFCNFFNSKRNKFAEAMNFKHTPISAKGPSPELRVIVN